MERPRNGSRGSAVLAILPWAIAVAGLVAALAGWQRPEAPRPTPDEVTGGESPEMKTLRLALSTSNSENAALRQELDRLLAREGTRGPVAPGRTAPGGTAGRPTPSEKTHELARRIQESLARAAAGDRSSAQEAASALMQVLQGGPEAVGALEEAYLGTADPRARLMMLPAMVLGGGEEARRFIIDQVRNETDPELRNALITQASGFATPQVAGELKDTFLGAIHADETTPQARAAALRGLRFAKGSDVDEALLAAAGDSSEEIRLAAIQSLAPRAGLREKLEEIVSRDRSEKVRQVGHCRLLLAQH